MKTIIILMKLLITIPMKIIIPMKIVLPNGDQYHAMLYNFDCLCNKCRFYTLHFIFYDYQLI